MADFGRFCYAQAFPGPEYDRLQLEVFRFQKLSGFVKRRWCLTFKKDMCTTLRSYEKTKCSKINLEFKKKFENFSIFFAKLLS